MERGNERLYRRWIERWKGSERGERLTRLGLVMFRAKRKAVAKVVQTLPIRTVLEVGCGLGHILEVYHRLGLQARGIDISPSAVAVCRAKGLEAELKAVEDEAGAWDLASSDGMLEHFLHFEPMARQIMRVSRDRVLLIQPNHGSLWGRTLVYLAETLRGEENVFEYNYRISDFVDVFEANGFGLERSEPVFADVFRLLLFRRRA